MATIIDTLIVKLGLDSSGFDNGKKKVDSSLKQSGKSAQEAGKQIKQSGKDGASGFEEVSKSALRFFAVLGGTMAIKNYVVQTIEASDAMGRLAKNMGLTVQTVSSLSNAAEMMGGDAAGMQNSLDMISRAQTELMLTGQSSLIPYLAALGVSLADVRGKALPMNEVLINIGQALKERTPNRQSAFNMGRMMGIDADTLNLILEGRDAVNSMLKSQEAYAAAMAKLSPESRKLNALMTESKQSFKLLGMELLTKAAPAIEMVLKLLSDFGQWARSNQDFVTAFLAAVAGGLIAIGAATIPINTTALAVIGLATAIAALYDDYMTFKKGGDTLIDWKKWEPGISSATKAIKNLVNLIADLMFRAIGLGDMFISVAKGDYAQAFRGAKAFAYGMSKGNGFEPEKDEIESSKPKGVRSPQKSTGSKEKAAFDYFTSQGWTKEQAAGIVSNIKAESKFNPSAVGDSGKAYGIAQWHPDRQSEFKKTFGKDIRQSSFEDQLAFMHHELTAGKERGAGEKLRQARTANEAGAAVSAYYERPRDRTGEMAKRGASAENILRGIPGASMAAGGATAAPTVTNSRTSSTQIENKVGEIHIHTQATNAEGAFK
ncbi:MAG: phage tail tip lysozyme, partial [Sulfuricella sp.]